MEIGDSIRKLRHECECAMCVGRLISVEEMAERYNKQISQSRLDGLSAWLKLQVMEEKKTKKMTKAEAFKWLDGKKIRTEGNHEEILRKLFDLGFVWKEIRDTRVDLGWLPGEVYGLTISNDEVAWWTTPHLFDTHSAEQVSVHDILSIEIVEGTPEFSYEKVVELAKPLMEYLNDIGWNEQIVVSYDRIVAQHMATCLYGE